MINRADLRFVIRYFYSRQQLNVREELRNFNVNTEKYIIDYLNLVTKHRLKSATNEINL